MQQGPALSAIAAEVINANSADILVTPFLAVINAFCFWPLLIQNAPFPDDAKTAEVVDTAVEMIIKQYAV